MGLGMSKIIYFICNLFSNLLYGSIVCVLILLAPFKVICILLELIFNFNHPIYPSEYWADDYTVWILDKIGIYTENTDRAPADECAMIVEIGWKHRKDKE